MIQSLRTLALLTFVALAGCASDKGEICQEERDCGGSLICARLVDCAGEVCTGTCSDPCDSDEDCGGNERCIAETGSSGRNYCKFEELFERDEVTE